MAELPGELEVDDVADLMESKVATVLNIRLFENGYVDFEMRSNEEEGSNPVAVMGALDLVKYSITVSTVNQLGRIAKVIGEKREKIRTQSKDCTITTDELTLPQDDTKTT